MQNEDFEAMGTPELDRLLQEELAKDDTDANLVRQLASVLEERDKAASAEVSPEVRALFDQFVRQGRQKSKNPWLRGWARRAAAALVAVVIAAAFMMTVLPIEARAESWWDRIVQWTSEKFEFISYRNASKQRPEYEFRTDNPGLQEVYDAVVELGVTDPVVPMWLPDGYSMEEIKLGKSKTKTLVYAIFSLGDKDIIYTATVYKEEEGCEYSIDKENAVEYENAGVTHYIMQNKEKCVAVWTKRNVECSLTVDCSKDILCDAIDSIYVVRR